MTITQIGFQNIKNNIEKLTQTNVKNITKNIDKKIDWKLLKNQKKNQNVLFVNHQLEKTN